MPAYVNVPYRVDQVGPTQPPVGPIYLRPGTTDALVYTQIWNQELYRPVMGLRDYALIIDGGANIGMSSLYFAKHHPNAVIFGVEPDPSSCEMMERNTRSTTTIRRFKAAIGGNHSWGRMRDPGIGSFGMQVVTDDDNGDVNVLPLDSLLAFKERVDFGNGVSGIDEPRKRPCLVKLDIEGAEVECFKDPAWMHGIDVLAVELHGSNAELGLSEALHVVGRKHRRWTVGETTFVEFQ